MKKQKINLKAVSVRSFVTKAPIHALNGGARTEATMYYTCNFTENIQCMSENTACCD